jgi:hypothetical protein
MMTKGVIIMRSTDTRANNSIFDSASQTPPLRMHSAIAPVASQASPLVRYFAPWACGAPNTSPVLGLTTCSRPHAVQVTRS